MIRLTNIFSQEIAKEPAMLHDNVAIENIITVISYCTHIQCTLYSLLILSIRLIVFPLRCQPQEKGGLIDTL